MITLAF